MIWLTWHQFRIQFFSFLGLLGALIAYTLYVGYTVRQSYNSDILGCVATAGCDTGAATMTFLERHQASVTALSVALLAMPIVIGLFWGAPLVARELESGTHRLVWSQSITRARWLSVKLVVTALAAATLTGAFSLVLTWAAARHDQLKGDRFATLAFASRNVVPVGYAVFAVVLGTVAGLLLRRTVAAMAVTLALLAAVQVLAPMAARPYLRPPVTGTVGFTAEAVREGGGSVSRGGDGLASLKGYTVPGALMVTTETHLLDESGREITNADLQGCLSAGSNSARRGSNPIVACLAQRNLHFEVEYHPAARYWSFQWIEFAAFILLTALLAALGFWRIRHVRG